jgi:hypothetical protein
MRLNPCELRRAAIDATVTMRREANAAMIAATASGDAIAHQSAHSDHRYAERIARQYKSMI